MMSRRRIWGKVNVHQFGLDQTNLSQVYSSFPQTPTKTIFDWWAGKQSNSLHGDIPMSMGHMKHPIDRFCHWNSSLDKGTVFFCPHCWNVFSSIWMGLLLHGTSLDVLGKADQGWEGKQDIGRVPRTDFSVPGSTGIWTTCCFRRWPGHAEWTAVMCLP